MLTSFDIQYVCSKGNNTNVIKNVLALIEND